MKTLRRWLWRAYYAVFGDDRTLAGFIKRLERTKVFGPFKPSAWHNDDGHMWEVWLSNESCYCRS